MLPLKTRTRRYLGGLALAASLGAVFAASPQVAHAQGGTPPTPGGSAASPGSPGGSQRGATANQTNNNATIAAPGMRNGTGANEMLPTSVLLFPATVTGDGGAALTTPGAREVRDIVTDALRKYLTKGGVGVVVYSNQLASIQRSVNEGTIKKNDAANGPGDDPRKAQQLADTVGATEFITASIENYKYDAQNRRATFNLNLFRNAADGAPLGTTAEKAVGDSPADVSAPRQEGSAAARAAEVVAEQVVLGIYPQSTPLLRPVPHQEKKKRKRNALGYIIPAAALGVFLAVPR